MSAFAPARVIFEREALEYPLGRSLYERFSAEGFKVEFTGSHNRVGTIPGKTPREAYAEAKKTLVFGVRRTLDFQTCKPSAHYQLPLTTSCPGKCEYCYLMTSLPARPYVRAYVNIEEILSRTRQYIDQRKPQITLFEGSATSDPVPVERYTRALADTIRFFGGQEYGRFRFVTKFTDLDTLLDVEHNGRTTIRFSVNIPEIIRAHEHGTPSLAKRLEAAGKVARAGYPVGFMVAPIILDGDPRGIAVYQELLEEIRSRINGLDNLSFEFITHRFTARAEKRIREIFPRTRLPMLGENRRFKFGQFGYGKYVYTPELMEAAKKALISKTKALFPESKIEYFV
ncbi:spore photoproduct lyase [Candidatus Desulforudis audaxviator]|uniref:Radical SAM domain protein n=1 Tax=Desulforudis audaxviator (strain MP104C) TaxID=477974 RepID=B1I2N8_DESAP|nr:spore photoproduct lyase [Candidatus Desulforudis audaxviator]ACA59201.1 Radical SAM domain protein [Candidatus Desulforudis audaxviator MP104C]AZK59272.1 Radical SAM domain protein [Candidatus Desulforudis audaxviator]